jgi:hypothetical protein
MTIILTNCTSRKKGLVSTDLTADNLEINTIDNVAQQWINRLINSQPINTAKQTYCGRSFKEAVTSSSTLNCPLYIVSAGLAIIRSEQPIPIYNLTVSLGTSNTIQTKITNFDHTKNWWKVITYQNPFGKNLLDTLNCHPNELILIALSNPYVELMYEELLEIPDYLIPNIRFFGKKLDLKLPKYLAINWMPYDDRLDSVGIKYRGTQTDFAQRALSHFVTEVLLKNNSEDSIQDHRTKVDNCLQTLQKRETPKRKQISDQEVSNVIQLNWEYGKGQSSTLLRIIRSELGLACAQSRFLKIYHTIKNTMENQ